MNAASPSLVHELRPRIMEKRTRLQAAAQTVSAEYVNELLAEIDSALQRIDNGSYGICEVCKDTIEADRLQQNPFERFCLDHLDPQQRRAHEKDLQLATQIQSQLLPGRDIKTQIWAAHYRYQPAGIVGGDYCEIVPSADGASLFFALGDVTGKGVAASLLMAHLSAIFRSLLSLDLPLAEMMVRANRLFCESTPATHYATLVAGRANGSGRGEVNVDLCSAGHCRPLVLRRDGTEKVDSTGLPLGLFYDGRYTIRRIALDLRDSLVLYSDGITEAEDPDGDMYGEDRFIGCMRRHEGRDAIAIADGVLSDVARFRRAAPQQDDMTLLLLWRHAHNN
ncbi:MAG TPA: SpoIIE family protein phosphatase [Bryobacteraceae bacterium]|nr:SpoIIE family protein phosphatase [Bryobacteraceae bacterium]